jgi:hypothetical protein
MFLPNLLLHLLVITPLNRGVLSCLRAPSRLLKKSCVQTNEG